MKKWYALGALALLSQLSPAYEKVGDKKLFNGEVLSEYKLKNGLRVLLLPRDQAEVVTYQVWFDVGSLDEKLDPKLNRTGLAHLFEHMMFRGSKKYPDGKFDEITSRLGKEDQNATTSQNRTNYFEDVPSRYLEQIIELESDRAANLVLNKDLLEKEKGAVVGELRRHNDSPISIGFDNLLALVHDVSPFRFNVIGTEAEIKGFTLEEAQYFYKRYYAPNNAWIIVVGKTTEKELLPLLEKYYGPMPSQDVKKFAIPDEPPQTKERRKEITHPQASSDVLLIAYRGPSVNSPESVPLGLLTTHLSTGMEARLRKRLVDTGLAVRASAYTSARPDLVEFVVQMAEGKKAEEAIRIIDSEIASLVSKPISNEQFERALNQELLSLYADITDNGSAASFLGEYLMLSGNYMRGFEMIEAFKKLNAKDIQRSAGAYLNKNQRSIVIVRPRPKGAK